MGRRKAGKGPLDLSKYNESMNALGGGASQIVQRRPEDKTGPYNQPEESKYR